MKLYTRRIGKSMGTGRIEIESPRELLDIEMALKQYRKLLEKKTQTPYVVEQKSEIERLLERLNFRNGIAID